MDILVLACLGGAALGLLLSIVLVIITASDTTTCPHCKAIIPKQAKVCPECGRDVE